MTSYSVPNLFAPQTGQTISSGQMDDNFNAVVGSLNSIENQILGSQGSADIITTQKTFSVWPVCTAGADLTANNLINLNAANTLCPIGEVRILPVPYLPPSVYGIEWAWANGQTLDYQRYLTLYQYLTNTTGGTLPCDGVAIVTGSNPQRFTLPDYTGYQMLFALSVGGLGAGSSRISVSQRGDMNNVGTPSGQVGAESFNLTVAQLAAHTHGTGPIAIPGGTSFQGPGSGSFGGQQQTGSTGNGAPVYFTPYSKIFYPAMRIR